MSLAGPVIMFIFQMVTIWWGQLELSYTEAFNPQPGWHVPKLFLCFDFCASLFTVLFFFVACFSLYLHMRTLWLRHRLLRNLSQGDLARLEAKA